MFGFCQAPPPVVNSALEIVDEVPHTAREKPRSASSAVAKLKEGNARYVADRSKKVSKPSVLRTALSQHGQNPFAVVIGCADSRCPVETAFDAQPGDIFVLRNAGNACPSGEGSIVASSEYAVGALGTQLLVVMGHTKCGAMVGATKVALGPEDGKDAKSRSALEQYLADLTPAAKEAKSKLGAGASIDAVAADAIKLNVFRTIKSLLEFSAPLREKVQSGAVEMHGALYDIETGAVEFLGQHPSLKELLQGVPGKDDKALGA